MSRMVLVVDVGNGQEAVLFADQRDAQDWLDRNPLVDELAQGMIPVTQRGAAITAAKAANPGAPTQGSAR